jgi:hypothetical protein
VKYAVNHALKHGLKDNRSKYGLSRLLMLLLGLLAPLAWAQAPASATEPAAEPTSEAETALIPRQLLFGNPERAMVRLSPDGSRLAYLAPLGDVMNVWVAPVADPEAAEAVTADSGRGIPAYFWAYTNEHILYIQDQDGDENWRVYSVALTTLETRDLTPLDGVQAQIQAVSPERPGEILVGLNDRVAQLHDLYRLDISTGERELVYENEGFIAFILEGDGVLHVGKGFGGRVDRELDMRDRLVTPGLINVHTHLSESPLDKSLIEDVGKRQFSLSKLADLQAFEDRSTQGGFQHNFVIYRVTVTVLPSRSSVAPDSATRRPGSSSNSVPPLCEGTGSASSPVTVSPRTPPKSGCAPAASVSAERSMISTVPARLPRARKRVWST